MSNFCHATHCHCTEPGKSHNEPVHLGSRLRGWGPQNGHRVRVSPVCTATCLIGQVHSASNKPRGRTLQLSFHTTNLSFFFPMMSFCVCVCGGERELFLFHKCVLASTISQFSARFVFLAVVFKHHVCLLVLLSVFLCGFVCVCLHVCLCAATPRSDTCKRVPSLLAERH